MTTPGISTLFHPAGNGSVGYSAVGTEDPGGLTGETPQSLIDLRNISAGICRSDVLSSSDEVMCAAFHATVLVVGTRSGKILGFDPSVEQAKVVAVQQCCVNAVSLDVEGRFCASATAEGRIAVTSLDGMRSDVTGGSTGDPWVCEHGCSILDIALCPKYAMSGADNHAVCAGGDDGQLVLHKRALFGSRTTLHQGEGPVTAICWHAGKIAWSNSKGVKVLNVQTGQKVTFIPRPAQSDVHRCCLAWASEDRLLIGWGPVVKVAVVLRQADRPGQQASSAASSSLYAEVRHQFCCAGIVRGLAPIGAQNLAVLVAAEASANQRPGALLQLCNVAGDVFDIVEVQLGRGAVPSMQHLSFVAPNLPMYVIAPRDIVNFQVRDLLEQALMLLDSGYFEEAVRLANVGGEGIAGLRHIICLKCVTPHLGKGRFEQACAAITQFRELEAETWLECILLFDKGNGLHYLAVNVPVPPRGVRLPSEVYDEVLKRLIEYPSALVTVLHWWPPEIFSVPQLQALLRKSFPSHLCEVLFSKSKAESMPVADLDAKGRSRLEALALLESAAGDMALAARLLLGLGSPEVFALLQRDLSGDRSLLRLVQVSIKQLFEIDDLQACCLLVEHHSAVPVHTVVKALEACDTRWRHEYLKRLFEKDEVAGQDYHTQMVQLFAEHEPMGLLGFLRKSERYRLEEALGVCQQREFLEEEAYLLGRAGRVSEALNILLEKMGNVERAVDFASEYQDPKLWEVLVSFVLAHPEKDMLVQLLECLEALDSFAKVGKDAGRPQPPKTAQPAHVLRRLPRGTPVPRIAAPVRRVFDSYELQESLYRSCKRLAAEEMTTCKKQFLNSYRGGSAVKPDAWRCRACGRALDQRPPEDPQLLKDAASVAEELAESSTASTSSTMPCSTATSSSSAADEAKQQQHGQSGTGAGGIVFQKRGALHEVCYERLKRSKAQLSADPASEAAASPRSSFRSGVL